MRKGNRRWRSAVAALTAVCLIGGGASVASAADQVKMGVSVGFEGSFKAQTWTLVQVTLENNGSDFKGNVEISEKNNNNHQMSSYYGSYTKQVVLPKGTTKQVLIEVPADYLNQELDVRLLDESGRVETTISPQATTPIRDALLIGAISAKEADLNFFTKTAGPGIGEKVLVRQLDGTNLPEKSDLLKSLDVLAINHAPKEKLSAEQIEAIKSWVQSGGNLLLSGGAQFAGGAGLFADLSPVTVSGIGEVSDLSDLEKVSGQKPTESVLTVTTGSLKAGANSIAKAGDMPLLAWQQVGAGRVFYAAYDLSVEPLASWSGNDELWVNVLAQREMNGSIERGDNGYYQLQQLANIASSFPDLVPSLKGMALTFTGYVLIAGPLLYLILRRKRKSEWAWGLIPLTSLAFAVGIYGLGSLERGTGPITQSLGVINVNSEDSAELNSIASFVMPNGGDYKVDLKIDGSRIAPFDSKRSYGASANARAQMQQDVGQQALLYQNVEFFSSREAELTATINGLGQIEADLTIDADGKLTGTLVNRSKMDLEQAFLLIGTQPFMIDDLPAGESKNIEVTYQYSAPSIGMPMMQNLRNQIFPRQYGPFGPDLEEERRGALMEAILYPTETGEGQVTLFGFSSTPLDLFVVDGKEPRETTYNLIKQSFALQPRGGQLNWPLGTVQPRISGTEGKVGINPYEVVLEAGSILLEYDLKRTANVQVTKAQIDLDNRAFALFDKQYYNWQTKVWEQPSAEQQKELSGAALQKYLSPEGKLLLKLGSTSWQPGGLSQLPSMGMEGKVSQ